MAVPEHEDSPSLNTYRESIRNKERQLRDLDEQRVQALIRAVHNDTVEIHSLRSTYYTQVELRRERPTGTATRTSLRRHAGRGGHLALTGKVDMPRRFCHAHSRLVRI